MKLLPSASRLQLALTCPASHVLPQVSTAWASGEDGKAKHEELARCLSEDPAQRLPAKWSPWLTTILDEHAEALEPIRGASDEVAFAWDHIDGEARRIGQRIERAYEAVEPTEFYGTADYLATDAHGVEVVDLKTGLSDVPHPSRNAQLRFLALAAARVAGVSSARVGILHAPEGRAPWWEWADLDAFELEVVAADLRRLAERIEWARRDIAKGKAPRVVVGEHCDWCPARFSCPARTAMARAMADAPADFAASLKTSLDDDGIASMALARWRAARKVLDEVGNALYARATERPIPLGDGRVWGPQTSQVEEIDAEAAWLPLVDLLGSDGARAAMTLKTSKAGIERGVKAAKAAGKVSGAVAPAVRQALDALRAAGAVSVKARTEFCEYPAPAPMVGAGVDAGSGAALPSSTSGPDAAQGDF